MEQNHEIIDNKDYEELLARVGVTLNKGRADNREC